MQTHIFDGLSVVGDPISDEDRVLHLLASLPDSYGMLSQHWKLMKKYLKWT